MSATITPDIKNAVLVLIRASADRMDKSMPNNIDSMPEVMQYMINSADEYCVDNLEDKDEVNNQEEQPSIGGLYDLIKNNNGE